MITISLCTIVRNEESTIGRCLETIANLVDEFIIVDTGSIDNTITVVNRFTPQIYTFKWSNDFAAARNYAFEQATMDYILWLDANDVTETADQAKLHKLKQTLDPNVDSVTMLYHLSKDEYGNVTFNMRSNRLVRRSRKRRNLKIYGHRLSKGEVLAPRDLYSYANELEHNKFYHQAMIYYENFLDGNKGQIEDNISACSKLANCYYALKDRQSALTSILRSLQYDRPQPEFCCHLGYHFYNEKNYEAAIFWYTTALQAKLTDGHLKYIYPTCTSWLSHLQLSVCYDRIGKYELACQHNEFALKYRPGDPNILKNLGYFQAKLKQVLKGTTKRISLDGGKFRILIGSPVRQQPETLERFLASLSNLEQNCYEATFFFIDNNDDLVSSDLLYHFSSRHVGTIIKRMSTLSDYVCNDTTHYWSDQLIWAVANYKNIIIQYANEQQFDGLFLIDSDILIHPHMIEQLLEAKVDIVSGVHWTRWYPKNDPEPNVWVQDVYTLWAQQRGEKLNDKQIAARRKSFLDMLQTPGLYEVGGLGTCTLISKQALEAGVGFDPISNLSFWGEDRHFCVRAAALGLSLYADTHLPVYHIYRNKDLPGADHFLAHYGKPKSSSTQLENTRKEIAPFTGESYE